jgi:hypothetical protein
MAITRLVQKLIGLFKIALRFGESFKGKGAGFGVKVHCHISKKVRAGLPPPIG